MDLSRNIIKRYVQVASPEKITSNSETVYGTVVNEGETLYVKIDGSDILTPVSSTIDIKANDRVLVLVKNHEATVIGSPSSPTARLEELNNLGTEVTKFKAIATGDLIAARADIDKLKANDVDITGRLTANEGYIDNLTTENTNIKGQLKAYKADIEELQAYKIDATEVEAKYATIESLEATDAKFNNLSSVYASITDLDAQKARIDDLDANKLSAEKADLKYAAVGTLEAVRADVNLLEADHASFKTATADNFTAVNASIESLEANNLTAESADIRYAKIDFANIERAAVKKIFSESGIIKDLVISEGKITGELVGVTIKGDIIEGGTVIADKLVVKGSDGLFYKLNTDGVATTTEQTEYNSLSGTVITAKSITAEKVAVDDLVAFGATIGGFHITDSSIYSGAKTEPINTTTGVYIDKEGQFVVGDANAFIKYYKDQNGARKLEISADSISFGTSKKSVETAINELTESTQTNSSDLTNYIATVNGELESLQGQIDGSIMTWFYEYEPTTSNIPATEWTTTDLKNIHLGDLFYNTITGYCYRWQVQNNIYSWARISDVDVTKALSDADDAKKLAGTKRRIFVETPTPPYDIGDLWAQGASGELMRCKVSKTANQSYAVADWEKASKYTDDTAANAAKSAADAAQADVDSLGARVSTAETSITQNTEQIALRATKTELTEVKTTAENAQSEVGSLKTRMTSAETSITQNADAIELRATKNDVSTAKSEAISDAKSYTDELKARVAAAETSITQNSDQINLRATLADVDDTNKELSKLYSQFEIQAGSISSLIRNGDTGTLIKQDANRLYYFDISGLKNNIESNEKDIGEVSSNVSDLSAKTEYISCGTDENDKPYIELGEGDSNFKLKITNEQIQFIQGSEIPAYITDNKLMIEKAQVKNELQFGDFVWKERGNGNMGLTWEEVSI